MRYDPAISNLTDKGAAGGEQAWWLKLMRQRYEAQLAYTDALVGDARPMPIATPQVTHGRVRLSTAAHPSAHGNLVVGKGSPMRARMLAGSALLALLVALPTPTAASAQAKTTTTTTTTTTHLSDTVSSPDVNPCTGAPGTLTETFKA